jgi:hypothetical protein
MTASQTNSEPQLTNFLAGSDVIVQVIAHGDSEFSSYSSTRVRWIQLTGTGLPGGGVAYDRTFGNFCVTTNLLILTGPAIIGLSASSSGSYFGHVFCALEVTDSNNFTPSTAPNDAAGPVNIILESSSDLVSWNPALPGAYGTTTTNRFFRLRAQRWFTTPSAALWAITGAL